MHLINYQRYLVNHNNILTVGNIAMTNYLDFDDPIATTPEGVPAQFIEAGDFEPARNLSEIMNNRVLGRPTGRGDSADLSALRARCRFGRGFTIDEGEI